MSDIEIPITEAFNDTDQFESLLVEFAPEQIEWLEETAAARGLSLGHMLRTIITAHMRGVDDSPQAPGGSVSGDSVPEESGDGTVRSPSVNVSETNTPPTANVEETSTADSGNEHEADRAGTDSPSLLERLRFASNRLQDLTDAEESERKKTGETEDSTEPGLRGTLERLQVYTRSTSPEKSSKEKTSKGTSSAGSASDSGEENASKTPSKTMLQNKSMFDMMGEE